MGITNSLVRGVSTKLHSIISNHILDVEIDICDMEQKASRWD
jgi:hypothetical protein